MYCKLSTCWCQEKFSPRLLTIAKSIIYTVQARGASAMSTTVVTGLWHDRSQNAVLGAILTLPTQQANLLLTALAVLVTLTAASFWNLVALLLHSLHARGPESDPLGLQLQGGRRGGGAAGAAARRARGGRAAGGGK